ncbi:molybdenum cofactor guanylyltransferase [Fulvivirga lutea]|uniref:Probable molybdenum cofactor guanylyltransferase n=1 Tax=Fulvivirga lutea TaxID=2810512 RepID=A0A974ZZE5_9BACT|nr:molybdenum cofactor guanylyltransferase [Fulvivirga lutea]QSE96006.1 molybdenum cofactor guanylyltransferase [Fulvivirga lutea]
MKKPEEKVISKDRVNGLVLMGGQSSRMGEDKAFLKIYNKPLFEIAHDLLTEFCDQVYISCHEDQGKMIPKNFNLIVDSESFNGPISGIRQAFAKEITNWLILPCDMPFLTKNSIEKLLMDTNKNDVVCASDASGQINPLVGLYKSTCSEKLKKYSGNSPKEFVKLVSFGAIPFSAKELVNLNRPEDWDRINYSLKKSSF